ncbi:MAG: molybdopterin-dependent oxidoreductase, partial [Coriobacteriales bacterium]|nr:molybdopterin-dependent oxidoreductase [Coriobacteriales bacterium]
MELSRRQFVKASAATMASAAAAGTLGSLVSCQPGGGTPTSGKGAVTSAVCRYCGVGCGTLVTTVDGTITEVVGDPDNQSNAGAQCVKGMHLSKLLYGKDRLTKPQIRDESSTKGTDGGLREAEWEEALNLVAGKLRDAWKADKKQIAFWASGQMPIAEGYVLAKFWKAGLLSNNIDPNARLCMASAVVAFMNVFGTDEPANNYEDLDEADVFVTWGANMAEAHPVLYSRLVARKSQTGVKHYDLSTLETGTSKSADKVMVMSPGSDNAIANYIANYIVTNNAQDDAFIADHLVFKSGTENLGNNYDDGYDASPVGQSVNNTKPITFDEYKAKLAPYTVEYASEISGVDKADLEELAKAYADPDLKVFSLWTMGVNQHNRGVWMNHNIYNMHLLTGKYAKPGCGAFSLTGQPTACGTAREVGTFSHRLPADLLVANAQHRRFTEAVWNLPEKYLDDQIGADGNPIAGTGIATQGKHTIKIFQDMSNGNMKFLWSAVNNWAASLPNLTRFLGKGDKKGIFDTFIVVNEVYPTMSTKYADVVFPAALWVEREGQFGNAERRTSIFEKAVDPPGEAKWDMWIYLQVAKRVLEGEMIGGKDAFEHLFGFIWDSEKNNFVGDERKVNELVWEEYRTFSNPTLNPTAAAIDNDDDKKFGTTAEDGTYTPSKLKMTNKQLAPYQEYLDNHGLTWPVREVNGKWLPTKWRFNGSGSQEEGYDQIGVETYGKDGKPGVGGLSFYKTPNFKPSVIFRPYEPPAYMPDAEYPFWFVTGRFLEQWHTGSNTTRIPELNNALPEALIYLNDDDFDALGLAEGNLVKVTSKYGSVEIRATKQHRVIPPKGVSFTTFFDDRYLINLAV